MRVQGGRAGHVGGKKLCECVHKIILMRKKLCQAKARYRISVWLLVPQGTGKLSYADHEVV